jgi:hypothetical protein
MRIPAPFALGVLLERTALQGPLYVRAVLQGPSALQQTPRPAAVVLPGHTALLELLFVLVALLGNTARLQTQRRMQLAMYVLLVLTAPLVPLLAQTVRLEPRARQQVLLVSQPVAYVPQALIVLPGPLFAQAVQAELIAQR